MRHVCIDGFNIALPHGTGIATYARALATAAVDLGHETSVLFGRGVRDDKSPQAREAAFFGLNERPRPGGRRARAASLVRAAFLGGARAVEIPNTGTVVRNGELNVSGARVWNSSRVFDAAYMRFRLTGRLLTVPNLGGVEIAHWTCPLPIRMAGAKNYYTFHDIIPLRYPHLTLDDAAHYYRLAKAIAGTADLIVTVSEHSRVEISEHLRLPISRISNTSQAVRIPDLSGLSNSALAIYGLTRRGYFLAFSAVEPKKNMLRLIEAYILSASDKPLIIAGQYAWLPPADVRVLSNMGLWDERQSRPKSSGAIRFLGHVPGSHLDGLIRHATAVMFPSITEGFGLPIIEAMGRGTAVVTSRGGATEETAGSAALLVDPLDTGEIARAMRAIEDDRETRERLEHEGLARAQLFTPDRYLSNVSQLYNSG